MHFATSLALRDNKPEERSGISSLQLLSPSAIKKTANRRKGGITTFASSHDSHSSIDETEVDHSLGIFDLSPIHCPKSDATSLTVASHTHFDSNPAKLQTCLPDDNLLFPSTQIHHDTLSRPQTSDPPAQQDPPSDLGPFSLDPDQLASLLDPKDLDALQALGGTTGILNALGTHPTRGLLVNHASHLSHLSPDDPLLRSSSTSHLDNMCKAPDPHATSLADCKVVYGENVLPHRPTTSLLGLMWHAPKDKVLVLLSIAAVVSLALGLFQDFGMTLPAGQPPVDWVERVTIIIAILIVVSLLLVDLDLSLPHFQKDECTVKVIRNGKEHLIDIKEVLVGDIALLEPAATGKADAIKKALYSACLALKNTQNNVPHGDDGTNGGHPKHSLPSSHHMDCFIVSGSKVLEGVALHTDIENTPLQVKLNVLAELIAKAGSVAGLVLFSALMIRFFIQLGMNNPPRLKGMAFVQILIISITLVVVAVLEGLPLAVTLVLSFATRRMTAENLLVRVLGSCETMANASVICTDKTSTLTHNAMTVVAGSIGIHAKFVRQLQHNRSRTNVVNKHRSHRSTNSGISRHIQDFSVNQSQIDTVLSPQLRKLFNAAVAINTTAFEDVDPATHQKIFIGSKTEGALLNFVKELNWPSYKQFRNAPKVIQVLPFSSDWKAMGVIVKLRDGSHRLYIKGASEILAKLCVHHVAVSQDANQASDEDTMVETMAIDTYAEANMSWTIIFYANQSLQTITICYHDFTIWPPPGVHLNVDEDVRYEDLTHKLTLISIVGIEDPLREGVRQAVADCQKAGVTVKMCTGDNVLTAHSIASQCGIFTAGGIIMEGPIFRKLNDAEMLDVLPRLQVHARSSPEDKRILVEKLHSLGEIVAVTGNGTNDRPALKTAHIGFSMGITGTEVAKDASDIVLMDNNFSSIVKAIMWGRCVNDAVWKFLQFQLSTNVTAVVVTSITAIISSSETSTLSAVQLLWINIIMDTFAALALSTDPVTPPLLDRKPDKLTSPLFTIDMYKQIFLQLAYQIAITLIFHFFGLQILGLENTSTNATVVQTVVFNIFMFAQIFNSFNSKRLDRKLNVFEGLLKNHYFVVITLIEIVVQVIIMFIGGAAFQVTHIDGVFIRLLLNKPFKRLFILVRLLLSPEVLPTIKPDAEWNEAIKLIHDNLATFANLRGGRLRSLSFVWKSCSRRVLDDRRVPLPSIMTMVPTLIASLIGAGWAPHSHGTLLDPARSSAVLWEGRFQVHPDTQLDDLIFQKWGGQAYLRSSPPPV
ncbi:Ca-transporting ATPase [Boletus reticuloceps]|uniref:Calcium-transporting ATPase 2 n=1 Tax=Boletus reticuloceps TaxID=495285 RepID=A0A8I3A4G4_9AGAM|nr:Ca-transporting ATPase [Boletus reticuloceps]